MYVENPDNNNMEQEVSEATAALKGMLGIGNAPPAEPNPVEDKADARGSPREETSNNNNNTAKSKKKKNNRGGKKKKNEQQQQQEAPPVSGNSTTGNNKGRKNKGGNKNKGKDTQPDKFHAWSAFQSPPDASKLPMPAFVPTTVTPAQDTEANGSKSPPDTPASDKSDKLVETKEAEQIQKTEEEPPVEERSAEENPVEAPSTSATGVNLAALASSPPKPTVTSPDIPATAGLLSPQQPQTSYGGPPPPQPPHPPPPPPPPPPGYNPYGNPYGTPPGYLTIQVRVPPVLMMPGRQMVVNSPSGYPVQVVVPPGIPPGAVIPVHVPAGPPMHMMPPPHPYGGGGGGGFYNTNSPPPPHPPPPPR